MSGELVEIDAILKRLPEAANACPTLVRVGRYCDVEFLIEVGEHAFQIRVQAGRVTGLHPGPFKMRAWRFAIRAGEAVWREFWSPAPKPGFNDIFAMTSRGLATIEGDVGPLLQNLRYFKELLEFPRTMRMPAP